MLGQKIKELVHTKQQPGMYRVTFDASGLASGVYIYRLTTGDLVRTKKMILVR
jgi:hypothetical protein